MLDSPPAARAPVRLALRYAPGHAYGLTSPRCRATRPWISRLRETLGHPVIVANARKVRAIAQSQTECDREDAQMLARLGRADPKLLSPGRHRGEATQRALVRLKVREALVRSRVNLVNSVRFLLKSLGGSEEAGVSNES